MGTPTTRATSADTSTGLSAATSTVVVAHDAATDADVRQVDDVDAEFFALVYSDPEHLRDEFEALVARRLARPATTDSRARPRLRTPSGPPPGCPVVRRRGPTGRT